MWGDTVKKRSGVRLIFSALLLLAMFRVGPVAAGDVPRLTAEEVALFDRLTVSSFEITSAGGGKLYRADKAQRLAVLGSPDKGTWQAIARIIGTISQASGRPIGMAREGANLFLVFSSDIYGDARGQYRALYKLTKMPGSNIDREVWGYQSDGVECFWTVALNPVGIGGAVGFVALDANEHETNRCISGFLLNAFGLFQFARLDADVMSANSKSKRYAEPTELDLKLLRTLYSDALESGMSRDAVLRVISGRK
jgi:hypothetical protein